MVKPFSASLTLTSTLPASKDDQPCEVNSVWILVFSSLAKASSVVESMVEISKSVMVVEPISIFSKV